MVQKRGTGAINKLCVREILGLSFVCGAYFFEFRGWKQERYACALHFSRVPANLNLVPWALSADFQNGGRENPCFKYCPSLYCNVIRKLDFSNLLLISFTLL